jgi:GR25 family glycosyltransferase involved in LPS biosynthesis
MYSIVYINLKERKDRNIDIKKELLKLNKPFHRIDAIKHKSGAQGCTLSHIKSIEYFLFKTDSKWCLICEDDFMFTMDIKEIDKKINLFFQKKKHILMLAINPINVSKPINGISKVNFGYTTSCYLVNRNYASVLWVNLKKSLRKNIPCDVGYTTLQKRDEWYCLQPAAGRQKPGFSDIQKRHTNYGYLERY